MRFLKNTKFLLLGLVTLATLSFVLTLPQRTHAGAGRINAADGTMDFEVNFRFPPTTAQITR